MRYVKTNHIKSNYITLNYKYDIKLYRLIQYKKDVMFY